ncbi:hypothetical protein HHI36_000283 [Cryptolaemus montrouzieri]|uniref:Homeobox domain-containing protein n=1 Tax=Cryptolaemus montrouzieri TaxID=559131 RepID=A0ABD2P462_9CUCU
MSTKKSEDANPEPSTSSNYSNFSIDHILNNAGEKYKESSVNFKETMYSDIRFSLDTFSWLQCTRYCPPKIPRNHRKDAPQKRQMGRHPRIPFTSHQLFVLEEKFQQTPYLTGEEVVELAKKLQLADIRVKIWFQNRRARDRREKFTNEHLPPASLMTELRNGSTSSEELRLSPHMYKGDAR